MILGNLIVPASNINYDDASIVDESARESVIMKRGMKYTEHFIDSMKMTTYIMYAGCVDVYLLPAYVVINL